MGREILHINTDDFYASVMRIRDPGLRGRPVIISGPPPRGMVMSASYEARSEGITRGMTVSMAGRLCSSGIFLRPDWSFFREVSTSIFDILRRYSPLVEAVSLDEGYIDYTGCGRVFGHVLDTGRRIKDEVFSDTGLEISLGVASSRLVSHVASRSAKCAHMVDIYPGYESSFLAPVSIGHFPPAGEKYAPMLAGLGISRVGDILLFREELFTYCLGPWGKRLYRGALGEDSSPVRTSACEDERVKVTRLLQPDLDDRGLLESFLYDMSEELGQSLRSDRRIAGKLSIELTYADGNITSGTGRTVRATSDDLRLFNCAGEVLDRIFTRRVRVRSIVMQGGSLEPEPLQLELFAAESRKKELRSRRIHDALDRLRAELPRGVAPVFGRSVAAVRSGSGQP